MLSIYCLYSADGCDSVYVCAASDDFPQLAELASEQTSINALASCLKKCDGGTHLWNATCISCMAHLQSADQSRPWVLIILTDGSDNGSTQTRSEAIDVLSRFNAPNDNFTFFIGLGQNVDAEGLRSVCSQSRSMYIPARDSGYLAVIFALIALQVREIIAPRVYVRMLFLQF